MIDSNLHLLLLYIQGSTRRSREGNLRDWTTIDPNGCLCTGWRNFSRNFWIRIQTKDPNVICFLAVVSWFFGEYDGAKCTSLCLIQNLSFPLLLSHSVHSLKFSVAILWPGRFIETSWYEQAAAGIELALCLHLACSCTRPCAKFLLAEVALFKLWTNSHQVLSDWIGIISINRTDVDDSWPS